MMERIRLEQLLEEKIEYSPVTALRDSLLGVISKLGEHPARRYLIIKHGKPEAVLMSFPTYEAFKAVVKYAWDQESAKDRNTAVLDAIARMKSDHSMQGRAAGMVEGLKEAAAFALSAASRVAIHDVLEAIHEDVRRLDDLLIEEKGLEEPLIGPSLADFE